MNRKPPPKLPPAWVTIAMALLACGVEAATPEQSPATVLKSNGIGTFAPTVKKVAPSVVNVYSTKRVRVNPNLLPFFNNPIFRDFFNEDSTRSRPRSRHEQSLGSGVIISAEGEILTNWHVVEGADEVQVVLANGQQEYTAKVVGADPPTDIAVLKVNAKNLPAATLGDSDKSQIGDIVLAIGNPFGVGQTVTFGIISATGRGGFGITDYEDFIQTDAAISPGNSGGALTDAEGKVVGIATAILTTSRGGQGIGFAVPINLARSIMQQILKDGRVVRGSLGVVVQELTPTLARQFKLTDQTGAMVADVNARSPAAKAGLKPGDVVIGFNSKKVEDTRQLRLMVAQTHPGTKVNIVVLRDGKEQNLSAVLGEMPQKQIPTAPRSIQRPNQADVLDGVTITDLDSSMRRQLNVPSSVQGPIVVDVDPESAAYAAGLRAGDVIQEINRQPVKSAQQAISLIRKGDNQTVLLRAWSNGNSHYITVDRNRTLPSPRR